MQIIDLGGAENLPRGEGKPGEQGSLQRESELEYLDTNSCQSLEATELLIPGRKRLTLVLHSFKKSPWAQRYWYGQSRCS